MWDFCTTKHVATCLLSACALITPVAATGGILSDARSEWYGNTQRVISDPKSTDRYYVVSRREMKNNNELEGIHFGCSFGKRPIVELYMGKVLSQAWRGPKSMKAWMTVDDNVLHSSHWLINESSGTSLMLLDKPAVPIINMLIASKHQIVFGADDISITVPVKGLREAIVDAEGLPCVGSDS